jgi:hypothetical protein
MEKIFKIFEKILQKKINIFLILIFLIFVELIYSFLFPAYDLNNLNYWKNLEELSFYKSYSLNNFDNSIVKKVYPLISNYHVNLDCGAHMLLAHDFPQAYFEGHLSFLNRPLYAFLVYLVSSPFRLFSDSYVFTFFSGILLNFILFSFAVILFYLLIEKLFSFKIALSSSILLIFSPFAHIWLIQPETNIFGAFTVIFSLYLLYNYYKTPSFKKLIIFSLIIGTLMLGKMLFAIPIFIILLAILSKRFKEGFLFPIFFLVPLFVWYLIVSKVFNLQYLSGEMTDFNMFLAKGWLFNVFKLPLSEIFRISFSSLPLFIISIFYGFLFLPVIFGFAGFKEIPPNLKRISLFFVLSFFILFFIMNYYAPRHAFLIFPVIYPLAVLGIEKTANIIKNYKSYYYPIFYLIIFIILIIISNVNIFKLFHYDSGYPWFL